MVRTCDRVGCDNPVGVGGVDYVYGRRPVLGGSGKVVGYEDYPVFCTGCGRARQEEHRRWRSDGLGAVGRSDVLEAFVVYYPTTTDYPGEWVVRRRVGASMTPELTLAARGGGLVACLGQLGDRYPQTKVMVWCPAAEGDDPVIMGTLI